MRLSSTFHNLRGKLGMENAITTMAEAGFDYKVILEHYFTGISVR